MGDWLCLLVLVDYCFGALLFSCFDWWLLIFVCLLACLGVGCVIWFCWYIVCVCLGCC